GLPGETQEYGSLAVEEATFNFTCGHGYNIHSYCCPDAVVIDHLDYPCASLLYEIKSSQKAADTDQIRRIKKPFGDKCARKIIGRGLKEAAGISEEVTLPPYRDLPVVLLAVQENQSGNCRRSGQNSPAFDREKVIGLDITGLTIIMLEILTGGIETPQRWEYLFVPTKPKVGGTLTRLRAKRGSLRFA
ncbi:MAG: hypothetical protein M1609_08440, partial [Firmicutes bacterium]|nr:hypothetical protein [Bacillota bacterium]